MNICVTGGAGFIGSHLTDRLVALGHRVLVIDNLVSGCRNFVSPEATFLEEDIRSPKLASIFKEHAIEIVFHEAAQTMVDASMRDPKLDCDVNLLGLLNVLEACRKTGVRKIIMPSSAAVYGDLDQLPLQEEEYGVPASFYGLTKLTTESYLRLYYEAFQLPFICFRYSNVYGPRQGSGGEGGVISIFCKAMVAGKDVTIFGDGEQTRDFVYVGDVVEANIAALDHPDVTGIFNVSTNTGVSVNELIAILSDVAKVSPMVTKGPERAGDIKHSRLGNEKINTFLHWEPKMYLRKGLQVAFDYFKQGDHD